MNSKRLGIGRLALLIACLAVLLFGNRLDAAIIAGKNDFGVPILKKLLDQYRDNHPDGKSLTIIDAGELGNDDGFASGRIEMLISLGDLPEVDKTVILQGSPGQTLSNWEHGQIGQVRVVAVVNASNPVKSLNFDQIRQLLSSDVGPGTKWDKLGVAGGGLVTCYGEAEKSASRRVIAKTIMPFHNMPDPLQPGVRSSGTYQFRDTFALCADAQEVLDAVAHDRNGIGFIAMVGDLPKTVKLVPLAVKPGDPPIMPRLGDAAQPDYPLWLPIMLHLHPKASATTAEFYHWVVSQSAVPATQPASPRLPTPPSAIAPAREE